MFNKIPHLLALASVALVNAQRIVAPSCTSTLQSVATPSVAPGYVARLVANNLDTPRGIIFDSEDNLLVVESGSGITALRIRDNGGGCFSSPSRSTVVDDADLNHGIALSEDGRTLYASSSEAVYNWDYSASSRSTTSDSTTLVANMTNSDHTTRTLLLSRFAPGILVVTRGSTSNIDALASDISTGHAQIRAFNLTNMTSEPYDFTTDGLILAWGVRNDVGIDEDPVTGGLYSVENSVDEMHRNGVDIHQTNPAEELNFLGYLNGTASPNQGANFGYPQCYTAWDVSTIPQFDGKVGEQFVIGNLNGSYDDSLCAPSKRQAPRLAFHPHMAPLDILFNEAGTAAWVTFHGSWDSDPPVGYKLSVVEFANGEPTEPSTSKTGAIDILSNEDTSSCTKNCFRPVGLAWDSQGNLFMSSDETGEIYVVLREDGTPASSAGSNATGTVPGGGSGTMPAGSEPSETGMASAMRMSGLAVAAGIFAYFL